MISSPALPRTGRWSGWRLQIALADLPLKTFLTEELIPPETDEVSRLIQDRHDPIAFAAVSSLTVGEFRNGCSPPKPPRQQLEDLTLGLTPEMVAAVSKIMRLQDLISVASKREVVTKFRSTIGLKGRLSTRNQPNHPVDDSYGIAASALDGLLMGSGDAVIGVNPATDTVEDYVRIVALLDELRTRLAIPTQTCCLGHVDDSDEGDGREGAGGYRVPIGRRFAKANDGFGVSLSLLREAYEAVRALKRGPAGCSSDVFRDGAGHGDVGRRAFRCRSADDGGTCPVRSREFDPLLVNTVVGFIGPEYLFNGKQIIRAGLGGSFLRQAAGPADGRRRLLHQSCGCGPGRYGCAARTALRRQCQFRHYGAVPCRRRDAEPINRSRITTPFIAGETLNRPLAPEFERWLVEVGLTDEGGSPDRRANPVDRLHGEFQITRDLT